MPGSVDQTDQPNAPAGPPTGAASSMPDMAADGAVQPMPAQVPGQSLAVIANALYLANLLLLPGIAFLVLLWLVLRQYGSAPPLARQHLQQALAASLWAGLLLVLMNLLILLLGGYQAVQTWIIVILYFTFVHASLVLLGVFALSKALAGQCWTMPVVGQFPFLSSRLGAP